MNFVNRISGIKNYELKKGMKPVLFIEESTEYRCELSGFKCISFFCIV